MLRKNPLFQFGLAAAGVLLLLALPAHAAENWEVHGDWRVDVSSSHTDRRDGRSDSAETFKSRLRIGLRRQLNEQWRFSGRLASHVSSAGNDFDLRLERYRSSPTGSAYGEVNPDELFLQWRPGVAGQSLTFGRFQTSFGLPALNSKNLDRKDSSDIGWTDGLYWQSPVGGGWEAHLIAQLNHRHGTGNTVRRPLNFDRSGSRISGWAGLRSTERVGPVRLRMLSLFWMPDTLAPQGIAQARREDYVAAIAKLAADWTLSNGVTRFGLGGEFGHAFNRPDRQAMRLEGPGDVGGNGWQLTASLFDFRPGHDLGLVWGRAEAGWLLSGKLRENGDLLELRYNYQLPHGFLLSARARLREDLQLQQGAERLQRDRNFRLRLSRKFKA